VCIVGHAHDVVMTVGWATSSPRLKKESSTTITHHHHVDEVDR
jgi:hypothetical protein